jgi:hypothetical protein
MKILNKLVNNKFFRSGVVGGICIALFLNGSINYAWFAGGVGIREFLLAFKK